MNATERTAWLEARRNGIGSSDAPAILGLSKWKTALDVYLAKVSPVEGDAPMSGPQEWGHRMEPAISAAIMDHHGWKLDKVPTLAHHVYPFLIASPDRVNQDGDIIEIKTSMRSEGWGEPETSDIPQAYWLQVQHQLEVAQRETAWVFVLIAGSDFRRYRIPRDADYLPTVINPLADFWQRVEEHRPPEPDWGHESTLNAINRLYEPKPGTFKVLEGDAQNLADEYQLCGKAKTDAEARQKELKARLIAELGDFEEGLLTDGRRLRRKLTERKGYTVEATSYHDFRILNPKGAK